MVRLSLALMLGLIGSVLLVATGSSSDAKKEGGKIKGYLPPGWKALNLTAEQKLKVYAIQTDFRGKVQMLEAQIKELKAKEKAEMVNVLTDQQKTTLRKLLVGEDNPREKGEKKKTKEEKKEEKK